MEGALTERVVRVLLDYWEQARSGQIPVVKLRNGEELKAEFDRIGVPLSISDKQVCDDLREHQGHLSAACTFSDSTRPSSSKHVQYYSTPYERYNGKMATRPCNILK